MIDVDIDKILRNDCWCRYDWMDHYEFDVLDRDGNGRVYQIYVNDDHITEYIYSAYEGSQTGIPEITKVKFEDFRKWYVENY